jgi:alpha 1,3-glucosidase
MNEPAVFNNPTMTLPLSSLHYLKDGKAVQHKDVHNLYGLLQHKATFEGQLERDEHKQRPFVLTRAFFFGSQKYGFFWTGDNREGFQELRATVQMLLSASVAGLPFGGSDVPSFEGEHTDHTIVCGYELGLLMPFFRAHSHQSNPLREPWIQSERAQAAIKKVLDTRYRIFPYLYTAAYMSTKNGVPIWRPMYFEYPEDEQLFEVDSQFMFGPSILAAPKTEQKFIMPGETVTKKVDRKVVQSFTNTKDTPVYQVMPLLPEKYYNFNSQEAMKAGKY